VLERTAKAINRPDGDYVELLPRNPIAESLENFTAADKGTKG
jgi:hypothetical protein